MVQDEDETGAQEENVEVLEVGEVLLMKRILLKPNKEVHEPAQRKNLFRTMCKAKGKCCKLTFL